MQRSKFLKFKKDGKSFEKGKFSNSKKDKEDFKRKDSKDSSPSQVVTCYECNEHGHVKKECPTYLKGKGRALATTLSDSDSSNSDSKERCDGKGNYSTFITITSIDFLEDVNTLKEELGEHTEVESIGVGDESDMMKKSAFMKVQLDCKNPTMHLLKRVENMQEWLRQPLER